MKGGFSSNPPHQEKQHFLAISGLTMVTLKQGAMCLCVVSWLKMGFVGVIDSFNIVKSLSRYSVQRVFHEECAGMKLSELDDHVRKCQEVLLLHN